MRRELVNSSGNPWSQSSRRKGRLYGGKDLQKTGMF